ncbi:site-specific integrase [Eubacteriales bacterium OttesenSCG-928-M02]|nr:site-specific integrase [Eubacteriales bacterium OttesenSCG-928-M02]
MARRYPKMKKRSDGLFEKKATINGRRISFYGKSEEEVYRKIILYEEKSESGRTLSDVAEEWDSRKEATLSYNSLSPYRVAKNHVLGRLGDMPIKDITPAIIKALVDDYAAMGYAYATVSKLLLVLRQIFTLAVFEGDIEANPALLVTVPAGLPKTKRGLPLEKDIATIKQSLKVPFGLFPFFILYTGCRRGEALALLHNDIDREAKTVYVNKSLYWESTVPRIKIPKTEAGKRTIVIPQALMDVLPKGKPRSPLFSDENGNYLDRSHYDTFWGRYRKETGIQLTPHQLRHAYATALYEAGIDEKAAQSLMGHASVSITRDIYTHISNARNEQARQQLDNFFNKSD